MDQPVSHHDLIINHIVGQPCSSSYSPLTPVNLAGPDIGASSPPAFVSKKRSRSVYYCEFCTPQLSLHFLSPFFFEPHGGQTQLLPGEPSGQGQKTDKCGENVVGAHIQKPTAHKGRTKHMAKRQQIGTLVTCVIVFIFMMAHNMASHVFIFCRKNSTYADECKKWLIPY